MSSFYSILAGTEPRELFVRALSEAFDRRRRAWPEEENASFIAFVSLRPCTNPNGLPELMLVTSNGRFLNPNRALQIYEGVEAPHEILYNYDEWELPPGASANMVQGEPTISFPFELSGQLTR